MKKIILCAFGTIAMSSIMNCEAMIQCPQETLKVSHTTTTESITDAHNSEIRKLQKKLDAYAHIFRSDTASHDFITKLYFTLFADYREPEKTKFRVDSGISDSKLFQHLALIVDQDDIITKKDVFFRLYTEKLEEAKQIKPADQEFWFVSQGTEDKFEEIEKDFIKKIKFQKEGRLAKQRQEEVQLQYTTEEYTKLIMQTMNLSNKLRGYKDSFTHGSSKKFLDELVLSLIDVYSTERGELCTLTDDELFQHLEGIIPEIESDSYKTKDWSGKETIPVGGVWVVTQDFARKIGR